MRRADFALPFRTRFNFAGEMMSTALFLLAAALLAGTAIAGLKVSKHRLKPRRIIMIIIAALLVCWALSRLIESASEPTPPGEGPTADSVGH